MFYLEVDLTEPYEGLTLLGSKPEDIELGRTALSNIAFSHYYGKAQDYIEALDTSYKVGRFINSLTTAIPYAQTAEILEAMEESEEAILVVEALTRLSLFAEGGKFKPYYDPVENIDELIDDPRALSLWENYGYTLAGYGVDTDDPEFKRHYILGELNSKDIFIPRTTPLEVTHPLIIEHGINAILSEI